jgi:hypothetical protein
VHRCTYRKFTATIQVLAGLFVGNESQQVADWHLEMCSLAAVHIVRSAQAAWQQCQVTQPRAHVIVITFAIIKIIKSCVICVILEIIKSCSSAAEAAPLATSGFHPPERHDDEPHQNKSPEQIESMFRLIHFKGLTNVDT